jgi:hypothetical protein
MIVMDVLGHSQIAVTMTRNIYGHVIPALQQSAADEIDAARTHDEPTPRISEDGQL